jgi:hypothetical protein
MQVSLDQTIKILKQIKMIQLKQQLINFLKSRSIFNGLIFNNKYLLLSLIFLILMTFIFNLNIKYLKEIELGDSIILSFLVYFVLLYLTFIKFNVMIRIFNLLKSVRFIYTSIKLNEIKDIKIIASYYYIFNIFIIIISLIFINRLNINLIYIDISPDYIDFTNLLSIILLVYYIITNLNKEFNINNKDNIKIIPMVINILILFTPFILLNIYSEKFMIFVDNYLIKSNTIYCDSKEELLFRNKLKNKDDNPIIISNSSSNVTLANPNSNIYVNTPSKLDSLKDSNIATSSKVKTEDFIQNIHIPSKKVIEVMDLNQINKKLLKLFIMDYSSNNSLIFNDYYYNNLTRKAHMEYKLDINLINFINDSVKIVANKNINSKYVIDFIFNLYQLDLEQKYNLNMIKNQYMSELDELERVLNNKYENYLRILDEYVKYQDYTNQRKELTTTKFINNITNLEDTKQNKILDEIKKFESKSNKTENIFKKSLKIFSNKPESKVQLFDDNDNDDYSDLFYKSNKSSSSLNSVDSDKTIKPLK